MQRFQFVIQQVCKQAGCKATGEQTADLWLAVTYSLVATDKLSWLQTGRQTESHTCCLTIRVFCSCSIASQYKLNSRLKDSKVFFSLEI